MKKWKSMIFIFVMLFVFSGISHGVSNKIINVTMNGSSVSVTEVSIIKDGQAIDIEFPSFVYIDRTLVPVRLAEELGAEIGWDQKTKMVTVSHNGKKINLTIDSDMATIDDEEKNLDKNSIPRLVTFANNDARTMVPLAFMSEILGYDVGWDNEAKAAFINLRNEEEPKEDAEDNNTVDLNKVMKVTKETVDGQEAIVIHGTKDVKYNMMKLKNPERIVVDILDSTLQGSTFYDFDYELGFIKGVRVSQFVPDNNYNPNDKIVRLVLDTKDGILDPNVKINAYEDKIVIFPEENSWKNVNYHVDGKNRTITINNLMDTSHSIKYDTMNKAMEISIPKHAVDLLPGTLSINDGIVDEIKIVESSKDTKLFIQFRRSIEYDILSNEIDNKVILQIRRDSDIKPRDRIIVVDPGHGGIKPGSISPNKVVEKDLNLEIALKVEKALKDVGYNIIMTRDTDAHVELEDRSAIANNNFADIFISIHANSFTNPSVNGIEILYTPRTGDNLKEKEQYDFAKYVLDEIIKETGAINRGLVKSPKLVVTRTSKMPAILVEVGFLSNATEEKLITNDDYQNKIVNGIIKGVESYFEMY